MIRLISAICTPLRDGQSLDDASLEAHLEDQWSHGIGGLLVAGTMGLMQLQTDRVYRDLVEQSVRLSRRRGEIMVGVGDTCFSRTRDRIQMVEQFDIDGVVVLSPYLIKFSQEELLDYFRTLADISSKPLYLYDLPALTGTKLALSTVEALAKHPNVGGIKCSGLWEETRQLIDVVGDRFRVIPAQPHLVDQLARVGVRENLDGIFSIAPHWSIGIVRAAECGDWARAAGLQQKLSQLLRLLREQYTIFGGCEVILAAKGMPCQLAPAPLRRLTAQEKERLLSESLIQELIQEPTRGTAC
ncbi:MAG: dihydrodipicolinate synthase family protein [Pirellulales bacterium]|nr:dihydrodipicolinate synthase family protein [Pirellulales bacterium]